MNILGVIPARYNSTRFPGKPLAIINGKPMIYWVYKAVSDSNITESVVALDSEAVEEVCKRYDIPYIWTHENHSTPTSRVCEVSSIKYADFYLVINGDEPLMRADTINEMIPSANTKGIFVENAICKVISSVEAKDSTNLKVVYNMNKELMYISRAEIPYSKTHSEKQTYKYVGITVYNKPALDFYMNNNRTYLEEIEDNDLLRFLENGVKVRVKEIEDNNMLSVDEPKDLIEVEKRIRR